MMRFYDDWEFNVIGVYNYRKPGPFSAYVDFIRHNHDKLDGDILEAGVFRGSSLLGTAMLLKELGSQKKVYGFDSFAGFPPDDHPNDALERFRDLRDEGRISEEHFRKVEHNLELRQALSGVTQTAKNISTSADFSGTSLELVEKKIDLLGLDNIVLVPGKFEDAMQAKRPDPEKICAVMMDCDLYQSYMTTFNFVWPRLVPGGMVYLDEYYSLKFPGARLASDEFIEDKPAMLKAAPARQGDFERWYLLKTA
ncbi:MAG: TylF/MycF/NovP-related O-methyltransferase [Methyloligellaceae bacterium]